MILQEFQQEFVVGDGKTYENFSNAALPDDREVLFILAVVSNYEQVTKVSYSEASRPIGVSTAGAELDSAIPANAAVPANQRPPVVIIEEDENQIIKLLEETDLEARIPQNQPIINGRGPQIKKRRKKIHYRR